MTKTNEQQLIRREGLDWSELAGELAAEKTQTNEQHDHRTVPAAACRFAGHRFEFADTPDDATGRAPIRVVARSGQPIDHWYWGRVVHDLSGISRKDKIPLDWLHDDDQVIGFLDEFSTDSGDLECAGALVPYQDGDKASEVIFKGRSGVPYEASIFFGGSGIKIEELDGKSTAEVNGYTLQGPATIIREWPLRGVAVCPYGADQHTSSEFSSDEEVSITVLTPMTSKENQMTDSHDVPATAPLDQAGLVQRLSHGFARLLGFGEDAKQLTTEGTEGTKEKATAGEDPQAAFIAQRDRFKAAFGPKGLDYLADGLTFEEAQEAHAAGEKADLEKRLTDLTKERDELKEKLSQIDRGEKDPADFQAEDGSEAAAAQFQGALGEKLAPLAAQNARALSN